MHFPSNWQKKHRKEKHVGDPALFSECTTPCTSPWAQNVNELTQVTSQSCKVQYTCMHVTCIKQFARREAQVSVATLRGWFEQRALTDKMYKATALVLIFALFLRVSRETGIELHMYTHHNQMFKFHRSKVCARIDSRRYVCFSANHCKIKAIFWSTGNSTFYGLARIRRVRSPTVQEHSQGHVLYERTSQYKCANCKLISPPRCA